MNSAKAGIPSYCADASSWAAGVELTLLELAGHEPQAKALDRFAQEAKTVKLLDPSSREAPGEMNGRWKIFVGWAWAHPTFLARPRAGPSPSARVRSKAHGPRRVVA